MSGRGGRFPCPRGGPAGVRGARRAENGDGGAPGDRFSEGSGLALRAALAPLLEEGGPGREPRRGAGRLGGAGEPLGVYGEERCQVGVPPAGRWRKARFSPCVRE